MATNLPVGCCFTFSIVTLCCALFCSNAFIYVHHKAWEMSAKHYKSLEKVSEVYCDFKCLLAEECEAIYYVEASRTCYFHKDVGFGVQLTKNGMEGNGTFTSIKSTGGDWVYLVSGDYGVQDAALQASESAAGYGPSAARLNSSDGWRTPVTPSAKPWIQVRFDDTKLVLGVTTQGRGFSVNIEYVTLYSLYFSVEDDCSVLHYVQTRNGEMELFNGNFDRQTLVTNWLETPFLARCVRLVPLQWFWRICLRFDVIGRNIIE